MGIQPEKAENRPETDDVDASINARLTRHLMENAVRPDEASKPAAAAMGLGERVVVAGGTAFLMSILGLFSLLDLRKRFL
ncbi:hypothetical protein [Rhizobium sp. C4]|uniref:hypothetical protein n=1 Tax=Rhizobium sp. C4 TaxID=1349800 RepID=UPI001E373913|nr:hypothetical protein [Rhizobium sp. C4]MCD2173516.1 hypothetical protein [Rhizobium sp. C4]